jgi:hypothetical protein
MPARSLVTVPFPPPDLSPFSVTWAGAMSKTGNAVKSLSSVMVQGPDPPHIGPFQPVSVEPAAGVAVKVTTVPVGNAATHVGPQSMPGGWLVTVPDPVPLFSTVRFDMPTGGLNVAVTDRFTSITTEQSAPLQSPLQPAKVEPTAGVAVKETVVPAEKLAMQVPGQDIPPGLLVTVPTAVPPIVTVSVIGGGGADAVKVAVTV